MTNITKELSPLALLTQIIEHNVQDCETFQEFDFVAQDLASEITEIWLPLFKSKQTLAVTLNCLQTAFSDGPEAELCKLYLCALNELD